MAAHKPMVSIICTNYNKGDWIREAIESFLAQETKFEYEIILIDDASSDNSPDIIREYTNHYPERIRAFYNKKNLGITKTWIKICKEAKGKYIARCDGDDYWIDTKKLQKQVDLLEKNKDSLWCGTDYNIISPEGELMHTSAFETGIVDRSATYAELLATKGFTAPSTWLIDTKLMQEVNAQIDKYTVDDTFNIQLELFNKTKLTYLPEPTAIYRPNEGSVSRPNEIERIRLRNEKLLKTQLEYVEKYKDVDYGDIVKILLARNMQNEMWAIERLQIIHDQRRHIQQQEVHIRQQEVYKKELEGIIHQIRDSYTYRIVHKSRRILRAALHTPIQVVKIGLRRLDDRSYETYLRHEQETANVRLAKFSYRPLISVVVPTYNTPENFLKDLVDSLKQQIYPKWELVCVDDASTDETVRMRIKSLADEDERIRYKFLKNNQQIADATNEGIKLAKGEFIGFLDHDDILQPRALYEVAAQLNESDSDFIYSDEDRLEGAARRQPFFKPDWNQDFMYSVNYITHFTVIRKTLIEKVGYLNGSFNGAQDWELFLRCLRSIPAEKIAHIPKVLYSWRVHESSTAQSMDAKPYAVDAQRRAIESDLSARGYSDYIVLQDRKCFGQWRVQFHTKGNPMVTIVIPDDLHTQEIEHAIQQRTSYENYTIITADDSSLQTLLTKVKGEYVVYVEGMFTIKNPDWIQELLADAQRSDIGFVQARLNTSKEVMQNIAELVSPMQARYIRWASRGAMVKKLYQTCRYNVPVVYGGITMVEKQKIIDSKLKSEHMKIEDMSRQLHQEGYRNLYNPYVR